VVAAAAQVALVQLTVEAHLAKTDACLLLIIVVMQGALGRIYLKLHGAETPSRGLLLVFWLACGAGILIKGPVSPMVALLTVGTLTLADRSTALLRGLGSMPGYRQASTSVTSWPFA
jgi:4-amino-4-deoxy-L-arabinose transferase-like glycosyltransferase